MWRALSKIAKKILALREPRALKTRYQTASIGGVIPLRKNPCPHGCMDVTKPNRQNFQGTVF